MLKWIKSKLTNSREKIRTGIDTSLQDNHDYYPCKLPDNIGFLSNTTLKLFFSGIKVAKGQTLNLNNLKKEGIVVYVNKYKSYFRYLFFYTRYKQDGLPFPQIGFDYNVFMWQPVSRILKIFS
jgi:glycerol-3-phosphate O-acyltransferase